MKNGKNAAKKIVVLAIFTALSLITFVIENQFPPLLLPGARMGLANIFSFAALIMYSPWEAFFNSSGKDRTRRYFRRQPFGAYVQLYGRNNFNVRVVAFNVSRISPHFGFGGQYNLCRGAQRHAGMRIRAGHKYCKYVFVDPLLCAFGHFIGRDSRRSYYAYFQKIAFKRFGKRHRQIQTGFFSRKRRLNILFKKI